ncbi:MAG: type I-E CRISPR-associated protein Cas7/Cse4/CasC [Syntrophomonadaceae bacterium]|jgi:CRISPR system Cascade subunit CasC|nr:type I-E CRISPR-associated protein Cas7/Cse4/CasC [Syntrophomonadaceae bacterium]
MNGKRKLFVDIHVIQSLPPSCVNRDDTGSPKTAIYGGVRRARVSSQAWKHAVREMFKSYFDESELGERTKKIVEKVAGQISNLSKLSEEETIKLAEKIINQAGIGTKDSEAKALFFMSNKQAENLAQMAIMDPLPGKKEVQQALNESNGVDISLFGRMVADDPALNTDASAQVAHAISTHRVENEYDYFTAMDDRSPEDQAGAGMIGTIEFNSSTLYRYATVAAHDLKKNLGDIDATKKAVKEFVRAFVCSMPTGKQNTFANVTPPYAVMVAFRSDQPVNLVGAFETPVRAGEGGYQKKSTEMLAKYTKNVYEKFLAVPEKVFVTAINDELAELGDSIEFSDLLNGTEETVSNYLKETEVNS